MNVTTTSPVEIDTEIVRIEGEIATTLANLDRVRNDIVRAETDGYFAHLRPVADSKAKLEELSARLTALVEEKRPYTDEYSRRGGWNRYYLVANNNGHLHTTTGCSTCYDTTQFCWITELSGERHDVAVAAGGSRSCLECFPEHREFIESGRPCEIETPERKAARQQREAEKAERARKAAEKGITNPDGSPLMEVAFAAGGGWRETTHVVKTAVAAWRQAMEAAYYILIFNASHPDLAEWRETINRNVAALAHKRQVPEHEVYLELFAKAAEKYRKERTYRQSLADVAAQLLG